MNPRQLKLVQGSLAGALASSVLCFVVPASAQSDDAKRMHDMPGMGADMSGSGSKEGAPAQASPATPSSERSPKNESQPRLRRWIMVR